MGKRYVDQGREDAPKGETEKKMEGKHLTNTKSLSGEKCLVVGSGISGIGSVGLLEHMGADVVIY